MVRLPTASSPQNQTQFNEICDLLPRLFSAEEQKRYIKELYSLLKEKLYNALFDQPGGARCHCPGCDGKPHDSDAYYEELAEVIIGRVLTWSHYPDSVKDCIVSALKDIEHAAVYRFTQHTQK